MSREISYAETLAALEPGAWAQFDVDRFFCDFGPKAISEFIRTLDDPSQFDASDLLHELYVTVIPTLRRFPSHPLIGGARFKALYGTLRSAARTALRDRLSTLAISRRSHTSLSEDDSERHEYIHGAVVDQLHAATGTQIFAPDADSAADAPLMERLAAERELRRYLEQCRAQISPRQYEMLRLHLFEGAGIEDICQRMRMSDAQARSSMLEARTALARLIPASRRARHLPELRRRVRESFHAVPLKEIRNLPAPVEAIARVALVDSHKAATVSRVLPNGWTSAVVAQRAVLSSNIKPEVRNLVANALAHMGRTHFGHERDRLERDLYHQGDSFPREVRSAISAALFTGVISETAREVRTSLLLSPALRSALDGVISFTEELAACQH